MALPQNPLSSTSPRRLVANEPAVRPVDIRRTRLGTVAAQDLRRRREVLQAAALVNPFGDDQRRPRLAVLGIDRGAFVDQKRGDAVGTPVRGGVQRRLTGGVGRVNIV